ncbi:restriction endonuclease subunit S [uncultured Eubacterium sp.]|uniref:restriction endonuclease subunit S n=1 Tax=uncultured Eubacterium sp. TaxID=165185 RepID=UPI0015AA22E0|nr:restriction endonuclease subunit S [uncultured Eubacterium sp.]
MNLDINNWKEFTFGRLICSIAKAKAINKDDLQIATNEKSGIRYITRTGENNGCEFLAKLSSVDSSFIQEGNAITIGDTTATCFYQSKEFIAGDHMVVIRADWLDEILALYVVTILNKEQYKYSYGRAFLMDRIKNTLIKLPIILNDDGTIYNDTSKKYSDDGYVPDWQWMENYIKSLHHKPLTTKNTHKTTPDLKADSWKYFLLKDICSITMGNKMDYSAMSMDDPIVNFVGRSADNNGVAGKVDFVMYDNGNIIKPYKAGCVTVALGGSLGASYLQVEDFYTSQNVSVLEFEEVVSDSAKLFITTCIMNESKYKYFPFGRELNTHIRTDFGFALPIQRNAVGDPIIDESHKYSPQGYVPDWMWMESYIKALPYGDKV